MTTSFVRFNVAKPLRLGVAGGLGTLFALTMAGLVLIAFVTPGVAGTPGVQRSASTVALTPNPPVVRDHRSKPVVRDHANGTVIRDQRGDSTVTVSGGRKRGTPCLGNLCHPKVCTASVCF